MSPRGLYSKPSLAGSQPAAARARIDDLLAVGRLCTGVWKDIADCKERRCEVAYAVDVDVIKLYTNPAESRVCGAVFSDSSQSNAATADLLGDFIVQRWPGILTWRAAGAIQSATELGPLLMIEPHNEELLDVERALREEATFNAVRSDAIAAAASGYWDKLAQRLHEVREPDRASRLFEWLVADNVLSDTRKEPTAAEELARIDDIERPRLVRMGNHPWFNDRSGELHFQPTGKPFSPSNEVKRFREAKQYWEQALSTRYRRYSHDLLESDPLGADATAPSPKDRELGSRRLQRIRNDAEVLARLECTNEHLAAIKDIDGLARRRRRLVLITGTPALHDVGAAKLGSFHDGFVNFAEAYLRHPRAFLAAPDTLSDPEEPKRTKPFSWQNTEMRVADLLSRWFPKHCALSEFAKSEGNDSLNSISRKVDYASPSEQDIAEALQASQDFDPGSAAELASLPSGWARLTQQLAERLALRRHAAREAAFVSGLDNVMAAPNAGAATEKRGWSVDLLIRETRIQVLESIREIHLQGDWLGAVRLLPAGIQVRGLPALRLDCLSENGQRSFEQFCSELFRENGQHRYSPEKLKLLYQEFRAHDASGYHADMLLAFVFAAGGKWPQVRLQCYVAQIGVELARLRPSPANSDSVDGREAAYLLAVAERRLLQDEKGLKQATAALDDAIGRSNAMASVSDAKASGSDLRFESERLAQFSVSVQLNPEPERAGAKISSWLKTAEHLIEAAKNEPIRPVRRWVIRQSVTNGLTLALIAKQLSVVQLAQLTGTARSLIRALQVEGLAPKLHVGDPQLYEDGISNFVWLIAVAVFGTDTGRQAAAQARNIICTNYLVLDQIPFASSLERDRHKRLLEIAGIDLPSRASRPPQSGSNI